MIQTLQIEEAEQNVKHAIDDIWNMADGMTTGDLYKMFQRIKEHIDDYQKELGH